MKTYNTSKAQVNRFSLLNPKVWLLLVGMVLLVINLYGFTQQLRPQNVPTDALRFAHDTVTKPLALVLDETYKQTNESLENYALRATELVSDSLLHIQWESFPNTQFNQLVPIWENYVLYFMGLFSQIPEYERYHFASHYKSLERGIGVCGDASMILSQLLDNAGVTNKIVSFPKHVVVVAEVEERSWILDPDFGVSMQMELDNIHQFSPTTSNHYLSKGYTEDDLASLRDAYVDDYQLWNGVSHFITNKYYFEKVSYVMKWLFPFLLMLPFLRVFFKR